MAEEIISSPRSWKPPQMVDSQELLMTKTFRGDRPTAVSFIPCPVSGKTSAQLNWFPPQTQLRIPNKTCSPQCIRFGECFVLSWLPCIVKPLFTSHVCLLHISICMPPLRVSPPFAHGGHVDQPTPSTSYLPDVDGSSGLWRYGAAVSDEQG